MPGTVRSAVAGMFRPGRPGRAPATLAAVGARRIEDLPIAGRNTDQDGRDFLLRAVPFPYRRTPAWPARYLDGARVERVPLDSGLYASQKRVAEPGLRRAMDRVDDDPPVVYAEPDGTYTIVDGHHRIVAAWLRGDSFVRARVVREPR